MSQMTEPTVLWATDEDIAIRAPADFPYLVPKDQIRAKGTDGAFAIGSRWTLTSASNNFATQSVAAGYCVLISNTATGVGVPFNPPELLVVDSVATTSCTLRRKGEASATGHPPGPAAGASGLTFIVPTLRPQIVRASYDINRRFGIDPALVGREPGDLYDQDELRDLTVLTVMVEQYRGMAWQAGGNNDHFSAQAKVFDAELSEKLSRAVVHWQSVTGGAAEPETTRFSTRIGRG